jgi:type II secretory ATPase GspE/PulE/Tfp pilus assembly ATPase PilB-like protein
MRRNTLVLFFLVALLWLGGANPLMAQDVPRWAATPFARGTGFYLQWVKLAAVWLLFLVWVSSANWVNFDAQRCRNNYERWNLIVCLPFLVSFLLLFLVPYFAAVYPLMFLSWVVPVVAYVRSRNAKLPPHLQVMTADHLRFLVAERLNSIGIKVAMERKTIDSMGPDLKFVPQGGATERDNAANFLLARQSLGFVSAKELVADALTARAQAIMLDYSAEAVEVRYQIDGVWHNSAPTDREMGDAMLVVFKTIAGLKPADRRSRQQGTFGTEQGKVKNTVRVLAQGTKTGERAILSFVEAKLRFPKLSDLGMRDKLQEKLMEVLRQPTGFVLITTPPQGGLSSTYDSVLNSMDRFTRNFAGIEDEGAKERLTENVPLTTYNAAAGESPANVLAKVGRMYPDVIACRNLPDAETVIGLCEQIAETRLIVSSLRAKETSEALLRVLMLKVPAATLAPAITAVTCQRLVRKLCEECKEPYPPPPQILKSLGIPAGKVEAFYRPPQQPEKPCEACAGIGYKGRTAFFELLVVDDRVRNALKTSPKLDVLRQEARKGGMRTLQEEGLLLVVKGVTSLAELTRVLKE